MKAFRRLFRPCVAALVAAVPAAAATGGWTGDGTPVCTAPGSQSFVRVASDGAGGAFIGWSDARPGASTTDVYLTRIGPDGAPSPGWPVDGAAVCAAPGGQLLYAMVPDGTGGVFLAWEDHRGGVFADVYGHHVLADGALAAGWPVNGLGIAVYAEEQRGPGLVPDGSGGVFAVWADARDYSVSLRDIYAQHLRGDGTLAAGWAANGMRVTGALSYDYGPQAVADPDGGLYVTWTRDLSSQDIGAQHLDATGRPHATWPDTGIVLCGADKDQKSPSLVNAPGGSAMALWQDTRDYTAGNPEIGLYAVRFGPDTSRAAGWPHQGRRVYATTVGMEGPLAVGDGVGGMLFLWGEFVSGADEDLFVMHADTNGTPVVSVAFPDGVVAVCPDTSIQVPNAIVPDGAGGAFVAWTDYRDAGPSFTNLDPYLQHVTAGAEIATGWPATGVALTRAGTTEVLPVPVAVPGGVIAAWQRGSGSSADLFASFVGDDGVVPALVSLVSSEAAQGRVRLTWLVAGGAAGEWRIERHDEAPDWREIARAWPDGSGRVSVTDEAVVAGARYGYRLAPASGGAPLGETWVEVPLAAPALALHGAWPNPVNDGARVRFALPAAGGATLTLLDTQGRVRRRWDVRAGAGEQEFALGGLGRLGPGVYWIRLCQGACTAATPIAIVR